VQTNEPNQNNGTSDYSAQKNFKPDSMPNRILAQNSHKSERKLKLRWILMISSLLLFSIFIAFGIVPMSLSTGMPKATVLQKISTPTMLDTRLSHLKN
jgi:hypothetical protein